MNNIFKEIKYKIDTVYNFIHRAFHGWGPQDAWSLDHYLSKVIYESLVYLAKTQCGYAITIPMKDPNNKDELKKNEEEWNKILNEMIYGWKLRKEIGEEKRNFYFPNTKNNVYLKDLTYLTRDENIKMIKGMKLFIKHFNCLWD